MEVCSFGVKRCKLLGVLEVVNRRTERSDPRKLIRMGKPDLEAFKAAHGETRYGTVVAILRHMVVRLDARENFGEQRFGKQIGVTVYGGWIFPYMELVNEGHIPVAERHHDHHRFDLALCK